MIAAELRSVHLDLTTACNLHCVFCPYHGTQGRTTADNPLPFSVYAGLLEDLASISPKPTVKLAGSGEPMLYPDFDAVVRSAFRHGLPLRLITNGTALAQHATLLAAALTQLVVSIHGMPAVHDSLVGQRGAFARALAGLEAVQQRAPALDIILHSVITSANYRDLSALTNLACQHGVRHRLQHLKGDLTAKAPELDLAALQRELEKCHHLQPGLLIEPDLSPGELSAYYDFAQPFILNPHHCWRIDYDLPISHTGDVTACNGSILGNIAHESILTIYGSPARAGFLRQVHVAAASATGLPAYCSRCCYNSRNRVTDFSSFPDNEVRTSLH